MYPYAVILQTDSDSFLDDLSSNVEVQNDMNGISPKRLPPLNANDCIE